MEPDYLTQTLICACQKATHYSIRLTTPYQFDKMFKDIVLVIDRSGSMAGSALETTKNMVNLLLTHILGPSISSFSLITYNDKPIQSFDMKQNLKEIQDIISSIKATGGTCFSKALNSITEIIKKYSKHPFLSIIFLTDGLIENSYDLDNNNKHLNQALKFLGQTIKEKTKICEIHALGVKSGHDPFFLSNLIKLGTAQGTYQYIKESNDLNDCFSNIIGILDSKGFSAFLSMKNVLTSYKIEFEKISEKVYETEGFLELENSVLLNNVLNLQIEAENFKVSLLLKPEIAIKQKVLDVKVNLKYLQFQLAKFSSEFVSNLGKESKSMSELESLAVEFKLFKDQITKYSQECFRVHPTDRPELLELSFSLRKSVNFLEPILNSSFKSKVSNDLVAQVNALAYKEIINTKLKKKLDKRAQTTVKIINEAYDEIKVNVQSFDQNILLEKYKEKCDNIGCCVLTALNFVEAIFEGDCLCISFHATRSEVCVVNPSQLIIDEIYPTIISANAFLDSVRYAFKIKPIGLEQGIEHQGKKILKGAAAEDINACLPIFISPEHWKNAKLLMKPVLGWVLTTDPLGYSYTQKLNIPFLLLSKVAVSHLKESKSDFHKDMFERLLETCLQILKDDDEPHFGGTWKKDFVEMWNGYLNDADVRCESVAKNEIFMVQAFCARKLDWLKEKDFEDFEKVFEKICEEELRRNQKKWDDLNVSINVLQILGVNDEFMKKIIEKIKEECKEDKEEKKADVPKQKCIKIEEILTKEFENKDILKDIYKEYLDLFKKTCGKLFVLKNLFSKESDKTIIEINNFKEMKINKDIQFLCLYLQNKTQHKNSDRKKAIKFNTYRDFAYEDQCIDFIENLVYSAIIEVSNTKRILYMKGAQQKINESKYNGNELTGLSALKRLIYTDDMEEAIEIFKTLKKTSRIFYYYWFKRNPAELCFEKLSILKTGEYLGEVVIKDWTEVEFTPRNNIMKRIYKQNGKDPRIRELFGI